MIRWVNLHSLWSVPVAPKKNRPHGWQVAPIHQNVRGHVPKTRDWNDKISWTVFFTSASQMFRTKVSKQTFETYQESSHRLANILHADWINGTNVTSENTWLLLSTMYREPLHISSFKCFPVRVGWLLVGKTWMSWRGNTKQKMILGLKHFH